MRKRLTTIFWNIEVWAVQKHVNLVDLVKSFPTNIFLQNLASIQKRTGPVKFAHLAEKSGKGSILNLSTKVSCEEAHPRPRKYDWRRISYLEASVSHLASDGRFRVLPGRPGGVDLHLGYYHFQHHVHDGSHDGGAGSRRESPPITCCFFVA